MHTITINPKAVIGDNCNIHKGVTIGQENRGARKAVLYVGNRVYIGVNSSITGNVIIGDDVLIGPNSHVNCNIPSHSVVFGNLCIIKHRMILQKLCNKHNLEMSENSVNNRRIVKNTVLLYVRTILILFVSLYTGRVVLNTLGVDDYGVYQVVGGVVAMFSVISGALSNSISRYITYGIGKGDKEGLVRTFSTSIIIQFVISAVVLILCEVVGVWFLNCKMDIPDGRLIAANWVLQCSLIIFVVGLISTPYNACIIAHEHMNAFAYISIIEVVLKLVVVYVLSISPFDKLQTYVVLLVVVSIFIRLLYSLYCSKHFEECRSKLLYDKGIFKEMIGFAGWNFFSNAAYIFNTQGVSLLVNVYFGVVLNAARGIATQVDSAVLQFVNNFTMAINPQITKSYASGDKDRLNFLICKGARFSYYLLFLVTLPILFETESILTLWLKIVPEYTVTFVRLSFIGMLVTCLGTTGYTACFATGNIKKYTLWITLSGSMVFFITWIAYFLDAGVVATYWVYIIVYIFTQVIRLWIMKGLLDFPVMMFVNDVLLKISIPTILSVIFPFVIVYTVKASIIRMLITCGISIISASFYIYMFGLTKGEKTVIVNKTKIALNRLLRK